MNTKILICFLPLVLLACKKHQPEILPEPNSPEQAKSLASTRSINSNGHSILVSYNYNSLGKLYQEISKDESTGMEMFQEYRHKDGILYLSDISDEQRKLSKINYTYEQNKLVKMRYFEYDQKLNPYFGQYDKLQSPIAYSRSNIIKSVQTDHLSNSTVTANYSYEYNRLGQPTSMFLVGDRRKLLTTYYYE
ncbi:hypothetical protein [Pedobacter sp. GR22-6]|uniref:hypothetical protein n=1 Tax=Pedobacter sp. GR22-6 TaxID=3127957 RepID=UPI00307D46B3